MRLQKLGEHRAVSWRNGLGTTLELAVGPLSVPADAGSWSWRISLAAVESDGPFSVFPDVDRTLLVVDGDGFELSVGSFRESVRPFCPVEFPGDVTTSARLISGPVRDLNVMVRRGVATASTRVIDGGTVAAATLVLALADATVGPFQLARFDAVIEVDEHIEVRGCVAVVEVRLP